VPSGAKARIQANLAVIDVLARLDAEDRPATPAEQEVLVTWSGWGAVPELFDRRIDTYAAQREHLKQALTAQQYRAAESSILNAHYTDPGIAQAMWTALQDAGFSGGRVLEPGCGSGTFIGLAPQAAQMVGVETDPITAAVAARLYPSAQIRLEGFETTRVPNGSFAAVIGNVPFGDFPIDDPAHNPQRFSIHNAFIIKSLDLTAPGGYVAVLTSHFTMDAVNAKARTAIGDRADLIGAVRLPSGAFRRVAGTEALTDVLILRRREPGRPAADITWLSTSPVSVMDKDGEDVELSVNDYFLAHPENVLGDIGVGHGLHGRATQVVTGDLDQLTETLSQRMSAIVAGARQAGKALTATPASLTQINEISFDPGLLTQGAGDSGPALYTVRYNEDTQSIQVWAGSEHGGWIETRTPKKRIAETRELLALRDTAKAVITSQQNNVPEAEREQLRAHLNRLYDRYVDKHGPINRFQWSQPNPVTRSQYDERMRKFEIEWRISNDGYKGAVPAELVEKWNERAWRAAAPVKRRQHLANGLRDDPGMGLLSSLEIVDEDTGHTRKSPIFSVDLLGPPVVRDHADDIHDALAICLEQRRRVDLARIAELLGADEATVSEQLHGLVYPSLDDPEELIPASIALSGNVRTKLGQASDAARFNPLYRDYVAALQEVLPEDKGPSEITARLGAPWIGPQYVAQFITEVFEVPRGVQVDHIKGQWGIECPQYLRNTVAMTETWGTPSRDAIDLIDALCNAKQIVVERTKHDIETNGGPRVDRDATVAAQAKATKISERFQKWVFADEQRRDVLVAEYNRRFNSLRAAKHDGSALSLPGLSQRFEPHRHQRDAVARVIAEPTTLLDHVVGAGKSGTMFMGAMELKRLGLVKQPWIVVPNHIIEQVGREAKWWYPAANILVGQASTDARGRNKFVAQSATSDWDMVIVPESVFTNIKVSDALQASYVEHELADLRDTLEGSGDEVTKTSKKRIEAAIKRYSNRLTDLTRQDRKDEGLRFEQTGCDYLFIDEAHFYKNKTRHTHIEELSYPNGSQRAEGLAMKLYLLRRRRRDEAQAAGRNPYQIVERVATFATGTPVANSLGELYVMQDYLRPDLLEEAGVSSINDWAATFTSTVNTVEVGPTGTGLRPVTRIGKFQNLPELLNLSSVFTDVVTRDDVLAGSSIQLPTLRDGHRRIVSITPSQEVKDFVADLGERANMIDPRRMDIDNILKISNDGRNVSLDPRLANLAAPEVSRASAVAEEVMRIHHATADNIYKDPQTGMDMPRRGGFQILFCDRGTPSSDKKKFTIYGAIRDELIARGMPAEAIRFIHDAVKPEDRLALFSACTTGEVSVLIGSTEKLGTGANIQTRATALHHVDVPWRPADLAQREGRIDRQGNQNTVVEILNYVCEGSYDTVMWQKVEAKSLFIEQIKRGEIDANEIEDIGGGEMTLAAAETKAIATGDSRYVRQVQLQDDVQRLEALDRSHAESITRRDRQITYLGRELATTHGAIGQLEPLLAEVTHRSEQPASVTVADRTYANRSDAAAPFAEACRAAYDGLRNHASWDTRPVATINGLKLIGHRDNINSKLVLTFDIPSAEVDIKMEELYAASTPTIGGTEAAKARGLLQRAENLYRDLPAHHRRLGEDHQRLTARLEDLNNTEIPEFEHRDELEAKRTEFNELTAVLRLESQSDAAKAAAAEAASRLAAAGRTRGWSLELNPTPALVEDAGYPDAESYRAAALLKQQHAARKYRQQHQQREKDRGEDRDNGDDGLAL
jgi:N12 class adenine-specific DNA methylase/SAM-dependent methyltransferase